MTPKQAKELLPILQAIADGRQIEERRDGHDVWGKFEPGDILMSSYQYRVKPEPLKAWVVFCGHENDSVSLFREPPPEWALRGAIAIHEVTVEEGEGL